jgi:hypothetical protein
MLATLPGANAHVRIGAPRAPATTPFEADHGSGPAADRRSTDFLMENVPVMISTASAATAAAGT